MKITWFGHSAIFLEMEGQNIFIDPMLGEVPAPHPLLGNSRFNKELPISIENLPEIDVVLISHDHYDHLDYGSIKKLKDKVKQFYVPLGIKAHLLEWGVEESKIQEFDWWEGTEYNGIEFVSINEIIRCEGIQGCTKAIFRHRKPLISSYNLGEFRQLLENYGFFSVHKSHLVNLSHIQRYDNEGFVMMSDGEKVPVARRKRTEFMQQLRRL